MPVIMQLYLEALEARSKPFILEGFNFREVVNEKKKKKIKNVML